MKTSSVLLLLNAILPILALTDHEEWLKFKLFYDKIYVSDEEEQVRFKIFQPNLKTIQENNALYERKEISYSLGVNKFADISPEELKSSSSYHVNDKIKYYDKVKVINEQDCPTKKEPMNDTFDWREQGGVTSIMDESVYYSGYSWAFAVAAALETQVFRSISSLVPMSAQQLIDCVDYEPSEKYYLDSVYQYVFKHGIFTEEEYPYTGSKGECQDGNIEGEGISMAGLVNMDEECDIKQGVFFSGTVVAVIDGSGLLNYREGIVDGSLCSNLRVDLNHIVLIVGYGQDEDFGEYWIVKNSWGVDWGENGYFRLARLKNNACGVGISTSFPIV